MSGEILIEGGCLCGAVRFGLTALPPVANYCHCTRCQRRTGTGSSISAAVDPATFRVLSGEDAIGGWNPPAVRSGYRQYVAYAAAWEPIPDDGLPRYDEARPPQAVPSRRRGGHAVRGPGRVL
jgi:hypothetical protein